VEWDWRSITRRRCYRPLVILDLDCDNGPVRITAKADYAVRAALELAGAEEGQPVKGEKVAGAQGIPLQFLEHILLDLKHGELVKAKRGVHGGYWLARSPEEITVADVIRAVEGPLANIADLPPEDTDYPGNAARLREVWIAVRANLRGVLEQVTLAEVRSGELPPPITDLLDDPEAWSAR
jgi:Rrf2 family protein